MCFIRDSAVDRRSRFRVRRPARLDPMYWFYCWPVRLDRLRVYNRLDPTFCVFSICVESAFWAFGSSPSACWGFPFYRQTTINNINHVNTRHTACWWWTAQESIFLFSEHNTLPTSTYIKPSTFGCYPYWKLPKITQLISNPSWKFTNNRTLYYHTTTKKPTHTPKILNKYIMNAETNAKI